MVLVIQYVVLEELSQCMPPVKLSRLLIFYCSGNVYETLMLTTNF